MDQLLGVTPVHAKASISSVQQYTSVRQWKSPSSLSLFLQRLAKYLDRFFQRLHPLPRLYHFIALIASNTRLLSSDSAKIVFNSVFSFSNSLSLLASAKSMSPYFLRQRWKVALETLVWASFRNDSYASNTTTELSMIFTNKQLMLVNLKFLGDLWR